MTKQWRTIFILLKFKFYGILANKRRIRYEGKQTFRFDAHMVKNQSVFEISAYRKSSLDMNRKNVCL